MRHIRDAGLQRETDQEIALRIKRIEESIDRDLASGGEEIIAEGAENLLDREVDRRSFMKSSTAAVSAAAIAGALQTFMARRARADDDGDDDDDDDRRRRRFSDDPRVAPSPYGEPQPTRDEVTGLPLIGLPPGFRYWSFGWTGDRIFPDQASPITPALHDGMGVLRQTGSHVILCRNHEVNVGPAPFASGGFTYSPFAGGGNTNIVFDTRRKKWVGAFPTLSGTIRNCGGGTTPQGTWLSCEETDAVTGSAEDSFPHGWVFEVPALGTSNGVPILGMGRREHEACAVDPRTGYVYLTEDAAPGGVYRFIPNRRRDYLAGGRLEMLKVVGMPNVNLRGTNPQGGGGAPYPAAIGEPLDIEWVPVDDPENLDSESNYKQGEALGGADFRRPEGAWYGDNTIYFVSTDGGQNGNGQVFAIDTKRQTLTLLFDSPSADALDNPDNLVVTPRGGLLFCEDNSGSPAHTPGGVSTERLVALSRDGRVFTFATNLLDFSGAAGAMQPFQRPNNALMFNQNYRANEWAGATFDRKGEWLFVNIQTPGITFAITGPWRNGPL